MASRKKPAKSNRSKSIQFTVDSALLQELGERLVGQAHIALAELIKNSFDADATLVEVHVSDEYIEVVDDGHGMDFDAFRDFWMRIGSPHKDRRRVSPGGRGVTGSKGVGRLSAQFLADKIELTTKARRRDALHAEVDWRDAVKAKELTEATAKWKYVPSEPFANKATHGTRVRLLSIKQEWDAEALVKLGRELWPLQPPFAKAGSKEGFRVDLTTPDEAAKKQFDKQMKAVFELWDARITGEVIRTGKRKGKRTARIQFKDGTVVEREEDIANLRLDEASFEVRVFSLHHRQPFGIQVEDAREYLREFGGVHVYDAGFHLPYYGSHVDWLEIEQDHAHRLSRSKLLPAEFQVSEGLNFLPTNSRLYGVVEIDTGAERSAATAEQRRKGQVLSIQISRDRLVDNLAYRQLRDAVRWSIDHWAMEHARREWSTRSREHPPLPEQAARLEDVLDDYSDEIAEEVLDDLRGNLRRLIESARSEAEQAAGQAALLGSLATAGMSAIAIEHETGRHLAQLERIAKRLRRYARELGDDGLEELADEVRDWIRSNREARSLFDPFMDAESREEVLSLDAGATIDATVRQARLLLRGLTVRTDGLDQDLRLPRGRYAEWTAVFQNVLVNAANATLDSQERVVAVSSRRTGPNTAILFQDTGTGVDLRTAEELFVPFTRRESISEDRRNLGAGGTGLGLTIVRMIASNLNCLVAFVEPDEGFSTSLRLSWRDR
ncbi:MAG TPA: ATP-binding protein [Solirubrobacterales bacterium]|nr:ATP-binding protein [Solirubrobacterales bacterium]